MKRSFNNNVEVMVNKRDIYILALKNFETCISTVTENTEGKYESEVEQKAYYDGINYALEIIQQMMGNS